MFPNSKKYYVGEKWIEKNEGMQRDTGANAEFQVVKLEKWSNKTSNPNLDSHTECKIQIYL